MQRGKDCNLNPTLNLWMQNEIQNFSVTYHCKPQSPLETTDFSTLSLEIAARLYTLSKHSTIVSKTHIVKEAIS